MTGEMGWNDLKDYPDMIALAKKIQTSAKVAAEVRPFDVYQGPFIAVDMNSSPLKGKGIKQISSWQISVWYCVHPGRFSLDYRHKLSTNNTPANIVNIIKSLKEERK